LPSGSLLMMQDERRRCGQRRSSTWQALVCQPGSALSHPTPMPSGLEELRAHRPTHDENAI
jgi:hypothetical protein